MVERSTILPQFVGLTFGVYNGQKFVPVTVNEQMVGINCEFSPTRNFKGTRLRIKRQSKNNESKSYINCKDNMVRIIIKLSILVNSIINLKVSSTINQLQFHQREY